MSVLLDGVYVERFAAYVAACGDDVGVGDDCLSAVRAELFELFGGFGEFREQVLGVVGAPAVPFEFFRFFAGDLGEVVRFVLQPGLLFGDVLKCFDELSHDDFRGVVGLLVGGGFVLTQGAVLAVLAYDVSCFSSDVVGFLCGQLSVDGLGRLYGEAVECGVRGSFFDCVDGLLGFGGVDSGLVEWVKRSESLDLRALVSRYVDCGVEFRRQLVRDVMVCDLYCDVVGLAFCEVIESDAFEFGWIGEFFPVERGSAAGEAVSVCFEFGSVGKFAEGLELGTVGSDGSAIPAEWVERLVVGELFNV